MGEKLEKIVRTFDVTDRENGFSVRLEHTPFIQRYKNIEMTLICDRHYLDPDGICILATILQDSYLTCPFLSKLTERIGENDDEIAYMCRLNDYVMLSELPFGFDETKYN